MSPAEAPERIAFYASAANGAPFSGVWTARPDGTDLRPAWRQGDAPAPHAVGAGPPGHLAFADATGLFVVPWDGSAAPRRIVGRFVHSFDWSPSGSSFVYEVDAPGGGTDVVVFSGGASRVLTHGSLPAFHTESLVRVIQQGDTGLATVLVDVGTRRELALVDAAVPPRAFAEGVPLFVYARDGRVYVAHLDGARDTVSTDPADAPLAFAGAAVALRSGTTDFALEVAREAGSVTLATGATAIPAGTFLANGTGLVAAIETAGGGSVRYYASFDSAGVAWPLALSGLRSLVAFRAFPPLAPPASPLSESFAIFPPIGGASAVWDGSRAHVFGGWNGTNATESIIRYDPVNDTTEPAGAALAAPLAWTSAVWDGRHAWIFGGHTGATRVAKIQRYDPATDALVLLDATLPSPRDRTAAVWTGSRVLILGGHNGSAFLDEIVSFDPATNATAVVGRLPTPRAGGSAVWTGERALYFGGEGSLYDEIVSFDPAAGAVRVLSARLPTARAATAAVWDPAGFAYVLGAPGGGPAVRYDPALDQAREMTAALPVVSDAAAVWDSARSRILLFGGLGGAGFLGRLVAYSPALDAAQPPPAAPTDNATTNPPANETTKPPTNDTVEPPTNGTDPGGNTTDPGGGAGDPGGNVTDPGTGDQNPLPSTNETPSNNTKEQPPARTSTVVVLDEARPTEPLRGVVTLFPGRAGAGSFTMQATSSTGRLLAVGSAQGSDGVAWDTREVRNGRYTVTAYDENGTAIGTAEILVQNPRSTPQELVVASAAGVAVTVGFSAVWGQLASVFSAIKGWLFQVGEEEFKDRLRHKGAIGFAMAKDRFFVTGLVVFAAGALLGVASAYGEAANPEFFWADFLALLPFIAITVGVFYLASVVFDHFYARHIGRESQFRVWAPGTLALTASTAIFATPFGAPGFIEGSETEDRRLEGRRGLATYCVMLSLTIPFVLFYAWRFEVYETGISTVLMLAVNLAVPVSRMPGALVWRWNKLLWASVTGVAFALYWVSELALGSPLVFAAVGVVGLVGIGAVFFSERLLERGLLETRREAAREQAEAVDTLQDFAAAAAEGATTPTADAQAGEKAPGDGEEASGAPAAGTRGAPAPGEGEQAASGVRRA